MSRRYWFALQGTVDCVRGEFEYVSDLKHAVHEQLGSLSPAAFALRLFDAAGAELRNPSPVASLGAAYGARPGTAGARQVRVELRADEATPLSPRGRLVEAVHGAGRAVGDYVDALPDDGRQSVVGEWVDRLRTVTTAIAEHTPPRSGRTVSRPTAAKAKARAPQRPPPKERRSFDPWTSVGRPEAQPQPAPQWTVDVVHDGATSAPIDTVTLTAPLPALDARRPALERIAFATAAIAMAVELHGDVERILWRDATGRLALVATTAALARSAGNSPRFVAVLAGRTPDPVSPAPEAESRAARDLSPRIPLDTARALVQPEGPGALDGVPTVPCDDSDSDAGIYDDTTSAVSRIPSRPVSAATRRPPPRSAGAEVGENVGRASQRPQSATAAEMTRALQAELAAELAALRPQTAAKERSKDTFAATVGSLAARKQRPPPVRNVWLPKRSDPAWETLPRRPASAGPSVTFSPGPPAIAEALPATPEPRTPEPPSAVPEAAPVARSLDVQDSVVVAASAEPTPVSSPARTPPIAPLAPGALATVASLTSEAAVSPKEPAKPSRDGLSPSTLRIRQRAELRRRSHATEPATEPVAEQAEPAADEGAPGASELPQTSEYVPVHTPRLGPDASFEAAIVDAPHRYAAEAAPTPRHNGPVHVALPPAASPSHHPRVAATEQRDEAAAPYRRGSALGRQPADSPVEMVLADMTSYTSPNTAPWAGAPRGPAESPSRARSAEEPQGQRHAGPTRRGSIYGGAPPRAPALESSDDGRVLVSSLSRGPADAPLRGDTRYTTPAPRAEDSTVGAHSVCTEAADVGQRQDCLSPMLPGRLVPRDDAARTAPVPQRRQSVTAQHSEAAAAGEDSARSSRTSLARHAQEGADGPPPPSLLRRRSLPDIHGEAMAVASPPGPRCRHDAASADDSLAVSLEGPVRGVVTVVPEPLDGECPPHNAAAVPATPCPGPRVGRPPSAVASDEEAATECAHPGALDGVRRIAHVRRESKRAPPYAATPSRDLPDAGASSPQPGGVSPNTRTSRGVRLSDDGDVDAPLGGTHRRPSPVVSRPGPVPEPSSLSPPRVPHSEETDTDAAHRRGPQGGRRQESETASDMGPDEPQPPSPNARAPRDGRGATDAGHAPHRSPDNQATLLPPRKVAPPSAPSPHDSSPPSHLGLLPGGDASPVLEGRRRPSLDVATPELPPSRATATPPLDSTQASLDPAVTAPLPGPADDERPGTEGASEAAGSPSKQRLAAAHAALDAEVMTPAPEPSDPERALAAVVQATAAEEERHCRATVARREATAWAATLNEAAASVTDAETAERRREQCAAGARIAGAATAGLEERARRDIVLDEGAAAAAIVSDLHRALAMEEVHAARREENAEEERRAVIVRAEAVARQVAATASAEALLHLWQTEHRDAEAAAAIADDEEAERSFTARREAAAWRALCGEHDEVVDFIAAVAVGRSSRASSAQREVCVADEEAARHDITAAEGSSFRSLGDEWATAASALRQAAVLREQLRHLEQVAEPSGRGHIIREEMATVAAVLGVHAAGVAAAAAADRERVVAALGRCVAAEGHGRDAVEDAEGPHWDALLAAEGAGRAQAFVASARRQADVEEQRHAAAAARERLEGDEAAAREQLLLASMRAALQLEAAAEEGRIVVERLALRRVTEAIAQRRLSLPDTVNAPPSLPAPHPEVSLPARSPAAPVAQRPGSPTPPPSMPSTALPMPSADTRLPPRRRTLAGTNTVEPGAGGLPLRPGTARDSFAGAGPATAAVATQPRPAPQPRPPSTPPSVSLSRSGRSRSVTVVAEPVLDTPSPHNRPSIVRSSNDPRWSSAPVGGPGGRRL